MLENMKFATSVDKRTKRKYFQKKDAKPKPKKINKKTTHRPKAGGGGGIYLQKVETVIDLLLQKI